MTNIQDLPEYLMSPTQQRLIKILQFSADTLILTVTTIPLAAEGPEPFWLLFMCWMIGGYRLAVTLSHYGVRRPFWDELRELIGAVVGMAVIHVALLSITHHHVEIEKLWLCWLAALAGLPISRNLTRQALRKLGCWYQPLILVGNGPNSQEAALAITQESCLGYRVSETLVPDSAGCWLQRHPHAMVAIAVESEDDTLLDMTMRQLSAAGRDFFVIPAIRGLSLQGLASFSMLNHEVLLLRTRNQLSQLPSRFMKRSFDILSATLLLLLLGPLLAILVLKLKQEGGPVFFMHPRVGRKGEIFLCPKLRTMIPGADAHLENILAECPARQAEWKAHFKLKEDPRITPFGRLLRRTSLDELPQLWSVLLGHMSLVGPRPVTPQELEHYGDQKGYYEQVLPGITGLWQISGRSDSDYVRRVALDVWYVKNWSMWTDLVILLKTVGVVLARRGAY